MVNGQHLVVLVIVVGVAVLLFAAWLATLVKVLTTPRLEWDVCGQSGLVWVLVTVLLGFLGAVLFWIVCAPKVRHTAPIL